MSKDEITQKADQAVEMFRKIPALKDYDGMDLTCATQCAIIMYEKIIEREIRLCNAMAFFEAIPQSYKNEFLLDQAVLTELKSRV